MPTPAADPISQALAALQNRLARESPARVAIAYSGGLDSTVLLHAASSLLRAAGHLPSAIHVHHGLSANADAWAAHCRQTCTLLGIDCEVARVSVPTADPAGPEAAARRERYRILDAAPADFVLLAHHADDQAETVLHNLLRGTGMLGLAGMPAQAGRYLRPLLRTHLTELKTYAERHGLQWINDESNDDTRYTRNHLRSAVMPVLTERFPAAVSSIVRTADHAGEAQQLLEDLAAIDDPGGELAQFPIPVAPLKQLSEARLINLLRCKLKACGQQAPGTERLREFSRQIHTAAADRHPALNTPAWTLHVSQRKLHLQRKPSEH